MSPSTPLHDVNVTSIYNNTRTHDLNFLYQTILRFTLYLKKEGDNYFDTLIKLREELEKLNIKLLCKGCCKNVYPSGMLLCMGAGRNAYTLIYGEQAKMNSLVDIFDSCSIDEYATIQEQLEYFEEWTCSLKG